MKQTLLWLLACALILPATAMSKIQFSESQTDTSASVVLFVSDPENLQGFAQQVNAKTNGQLTAAMKTSEFTGKFGSSQNFYGVAPYQHILVVGSGNQSDKLTTAQLVDLGGYAAKGLKSNSINQIDVYANGLNTDQNTPAAYIAMGFKLQSYAFSKYKKTNESQAQETTLTLVTNKTADNQNRFENDLQHVSEGVYLARDMASEPGKSIYPQAFVDRVKAKFKGVDNIDIDVLDVKDMRRYKMGALMGVGQGSVHDPRMLVISYEGGKTDEAPIALVGKGITFDTGGISIKPNKNMWTMKSDLSGAAAVAGTLLAAAKREEKINLVGLMPLAENMPAADAIRPGDVLNTMQGTTIEIISTDAEGRLILADAVRYAQTKFSPRMLVNIATLTGSAARALGDEYAAVITRDFSLSQKMMEIGKASGEQVWPLPLHPNHFKQIKSDIADIKNSGAGNPGASIGAAVVGTFVDESLPWVHLDIAGVDYLEQSTATTPRGFAGWGVRFLDQLIRENVK